jgi:hypothetical protein
MLAIETSTTGQKPIATKLPYKRQQDEVHQTAGTKVTINTTKHQAIRKQPLHRHPKDTRRSPTTASIRSNTRSDCTRQRHVLNVSIIAAEVLPFTDDPLPLSLIKKEFTRKK